MIILGIHMDLATCGWASLDTERRAFVDLGSKATTLEMRSSDVLAEKVCGADVVAVERAHLMRGGFVAMNLIAMVEPPPRLLTIAPQRWQREVLPNLLLTQPNRDELALKAAAHILMRHPAVASKLEAIEPEERYHAIVAAMLALVATLQMERVN